MAIIDIKDATIKIKDGTTGTPLEVTVKIGTGNLTFTETQNREYILEKGSLANGSVRNADDEPVEVNLDIMWDWYRGISGAVSPMDAITGTGTASAWVSSGADLCEPYAVDIEVTIDRNCTTPATPDETITLGEFRWETINGDLSAGQLSVRGRCKITRVTAVRS